MSRGKAEPEEIETTVDREKIAAGARSNYYLKGWRETIQAMPVKLIDEILDKQNTGKHPMRDAP